MTGDLVPFKKKQVQPSRYHYDWAAAWAFFAEDPTRGYADVHRKFGMHERTIRLHARKHNWEERRQQLVAQAVARTDKKIVRSLQERHERTIEVAEKLRDAILDKDVTVEVKDAVSSLPAYAKLEQLFGGGATENLRALPMIDADNLTAEELETLAALLEKGQKAS